MKNINKIIGLLLLVISFVACDEENHFQDSNIALTSVYSVTNISNNGPFKINVYQDNALVIEYVSASNAVKYTSSGYVDSSTETDYQLEWQITKERLVDNDGIEELETYTAAHILSADKESGLGSVDVTSTFKDGSSVITVHNVTVTEDEVYN